MQKNNTFDPNAAAQRFISNVKPAPIATKTPTAPGKSKLKQKAYYITPEQEKRIKVYAVENGTDASAVIREAIDRYFNDK